jgi:glycosyltransferase involved in cell wall biosynthesis
MRVAMLILEYHPINGGAQKQLAALGPRLQRRGIEIHVLTRHVDGYPARDVVDGIPVSRLPAPGPKASASAVFTAAAMLRLRELAPDVVHAHSLFSPTTVAILAHRFLRVPTVAKVLRGGEPGDVTRIGRKAFARLRTAAIRQHIDRFAIISQEIDAELGAIGVAAEKRIELPNGVDLERFQPLTPTARNAQRSSLGVEEGPLVVFCGRLVPEKGVDRLLDAWRKVREHRPEAQLVILGGGPLESGLRAAAGPGVRFAGELSDVSPWLRAADAFVLPSSAEGLSNAMLEAMAAALPIVATRVGGAADCIEHGRSGLLVPPEDTNALADTLAGLLADPHRAQLGARARAIAEQRYSLESLADRLAALYVELGRGPAQLDHTERHASDGEVAA